MDFVVAQQSLNGLPHNPSRNYPETKRVKRRGQHLSSLIAERALNGLVIIVRGVIVTLMRAVVVMTIIGRCQGYDSSMEIRIAVGLSNSSIKAGPGLQVAKVMVFKTVNRRFLEL